MGDPKTTSSLPPGCRFYPSEEQLLSYYLHHKNTTTTNNNSSGGGILYNTIQEINFYDYTPFELPECTCFRFGFRGLKRHWYCYTAAGLIGEDERGRRRAGFGFWKRKGGVIDVTCNGGRVILGRRKCFIFYLEKSKGRKFVKTNWFMYEYALLDNLEASFVVCRVFVKSRHRNNISELALSSSAEDKVKTTVRHIGIQHDGNTLGLANEDKAHQDYAKLMTVGETTRLFGDIPPNNLMTSFGISSSNNLVIDSPRDLVSILEGDFLEMDDLI